MLHEGADSYIDGASASQAAKVHEGTATHTTRAPVPQATKGLHEGDVALFEGVVRRVSSSHRCKSLPSKDGIKVDVDEAARSNKRSRHGKHRSSSSTKRSRLGNDLVDATKEREMSLEMAEAVEQPRLVY
ncbi:hypothetical protein V6N13_055207 [Hibiscus sabdariffa]